ncbi:MAG: cytochrome c [Candidatus Velthaea sp.]
MTRAIAAALAAGAALLFTTPAPARGAGDPAVAAGARLFTAVGCYECHGYQGQGGAAGPRIAAPPMPYAALAAYVRRPRREMPPYTPAVLKDEDLRAIYAYLQSIPKPPPPQSLPLLNR